MLWLLSCVPSLPADPAPADSPLRGVDSAGPLEEVPPAPGPDAVFDPWTVHSLDILLDEGALAALRTAPKEPVQGRIVFDGHELGGVGVRLKGSASFQDVDHKPAWKLELDADAPGQRLHGLERLTLNNEVWDPTMMAETMAYRAFRENGSPAPRTGYAAVRLNDRALGLYAILESMDDDFVEHTWPGSEGGLWEMTRGCDFGGDCACFELQESGEAFDPQGLVRGCEAAAEGSPEAIAAAFDLDAVVAFLAVEWAVNHPDSYSHNHNNFFVYHDPLEDRLSLSPWGADSTFIYAYPPSKPNPGCEPLYLDVDTRAPTGWLSAFCRADPACGAALDQKLLEVADWMESVDLVADMQRNAALLQPYAEQESLVNWTLADREARVACFQQWTAQRPEELRALVGR